MTPGQVYRTRDGVRWQVIPSGKVVVTQPFTVLAEQVNKPRLRNWYTVEGRWSCNGVTSVDLVERIA